MGIDNVQLKEELEGYKLERNINDWKDFIWFKLQQLNFNHA